MSVDVTVVGDDEERFAFKTRTIDLSRHGAAVLMDRFVLLNTRVELTSNAPPFTTLAEVRSNRTDQATGAPVIGLAYLGDVRYPLSRPRRRR